VPRSIESERQRLPLRAAVVANLEEVRELPSEVDISKAMVMVKVDQEQVASTKKPGYKRLVIMLFQSKRLRHIGPSSSWVLPP